MIVKQAPGDTAGEMVLYGERWRPEPPDADCLRRFGSLTLPVLDRLSNTSANPAQADNNGNIRRMDHFVPNGVDASGNITSWVMGLDVYSYDWLNRITSVSEQQQNQGRQWTAVFTQAFSYDRWGNRTINVGATTPSVAGVTRKTFAVDKVYQPANFGKISACFQTRLENRGANSTIMGSNSVNSSRADIRYNYEYGSLSSGRCELVYQTISATH
jgi:hypothetical protein